MAPDYDLSNLVDEQVDLWIYLQGDTIFRRLMADQAERRGFPLPFSERRRLGGKRQAVGDIQQRVTGSGRIGGCLRQ